MSRVNGIDVCFGGVPVPCLSMAPRDSICLSRWRQSCIRYVNSTGGYGQALTSPPSNLRKCSTFLLLLHGGTRSSFCWTQLAATNGDLDFADKAHDRAFHSVPNQQPNPSQLAPGSPYSVEGVVTKIVFRSSDSNYRVVKVKTSARSAVDTIAGNFNMEDFSEGAIITATGRLDNHSKYGLQLKVVSYQITVQDRKELMPLIESKSKHRKRDSDLLILQRLPHVGPKTAEAILERFGGDAVDEIIKDPSLLHEVSGISEARFVIISEKLREMDLSYERFMTRLGFTDNMRKTVERFFSDKSKHQIMAKIKANPYALARVVPRVSFPVADAWARSLGLPNDSQGRYFVAAQFALERAAAVFGNTFLFWNELVYETNRLLQTDSFVFEKEKLNLVLEQAVQERTMISEVNRRTSGIASGYGSDDGDAVAIPGSSKSQDHAKDGNLRIYLRALYEAEVTVAEGIVLAMRNTRDISEKQRVSYVRKANEFLKDFESRFDAKLNDAQKQTVHAAATSHFVVLTGGPGVGKTFVTRIIQDLWSFMGMKVATCAPTGRAAQNLNTNTAARDGVSRLNAVTIHKLVGIRADEDIEKKSSSEENHIGSYQAFIVDEISMLDIYVARRLFGEIKSKSPSARILLVGDPFQLPSVAAGRILHDLCDMKSRIPFVTLHEVFRQAAQSRIVTTAHAIRSGNTNVQELLEPLTDPTKDLVYINSDNELSAVEQVLYCVDALKTNYGFDPCKDIQVLCPVKKGQAGVHSLNARLQAKLNSTGKPIFRVGDGSQQGSFSKQAKDKKKARAAKQSSADSNGDQTIADEEEGDDDDVNQSMQFLQGDRVIHTVNNYTKGVLNGEIGHIVYGDRSKLFVQYPGKSKLMEYSRQEATNELLLAYALTVHKSQGSEFPCCIVVFMSNNAVLCTRNVLYTSLTRARKMCVLVSSQQIIGKSLRNVTSDERNSGLRSKLESWIPTERES